MNVQDWHREALARQVVEKLKINGFDAVYFSSRQEAVEHVLSYINSGTVVGIGGSMTLVELGIPDLAQAKGAQVLNHNLSGLSPEEKLEIRRRQLVSDVFLCSSNGITLDGCLVNVDGAGNRVAALTFGPKKVVVVAGVNKICRDVEAAFDRVKTTASPMNNKRLNRPNPCTVTGVCADCQGKTRICRIYSVIKKLPMGADITVVMVGEDLGY